MMKFIRHKDAAGRMPERGKRKGSLRGIPGLALILAFGVVLAAGGMRTRAYAFEAPGIEENGELVTFPGTSGKGNGTKAAGGNKWASGLEEGTTLAILSEGEPTTISAGDKSSKLQDFLTAVSITDKDGNPIEGGTLYVGEDYQIHLAFTEKGPAGLQFDTSGNLTYQIPRNFEVKPQTGAELKVEIKRSGGSYETVTIGTYSIDENGMLTVELSEDGKKELDGAVDIAISFDMEATAQAVDGSGDGKVHFDDAGTDFGFTIVDQPRVSVEKAGKYTENSNKTGGKLEYTVTTKVEHGEVYNLETKDVLTPPQTQALELSMEKTAEGDPAVTVMVRHKKENGAYEEILLTSKDYVLEELDGDPENPKDKAFQVKLTDKCDYNPLSEGDELYVTYNYDVEYVPGSTDTFWGNVVNTATVTGTMQVTDPSNPDKKIEAPITQESGSNVEIYAVPPGDGIVFKEESYDEYRKTLHYTLYTLVPAVKGGEEWNPFHIFDDMVVEYNGRNWYLPEFKPGEDGDRRVRNLTVKAVDADELDWGDGTNNAQKIEDLKKLKETIKGMNPLQGYAFGGDLSGYVPGVDDYVYYYNDTGLYIIFGATTEELSSENYHKMWGNWGHWKYDKNRLIVTEYDLDMSDVTGNDTITLTEVNGSEKLELSPDKVLLAGIRNKVNLRLSSYNLGYTVFFNNKEKINKTGKLNKNDNTIDYTVTMNTTDSTVWGYFWDVNKDWYAQNDINKYNWDANRAYPESMQAVFYDVLPDGWEYVEGSLSVTTQDIYKNNYYFVYGASEVAGYDKPPVIEDGGKQKIEAPLVFFFEPSRLEGKPGMELFNTFSSTLVQITFTYKLKATDDWLAEYANIDGSVPVKNHVEIHDKKGTHWSTDAEVPYIPAKLTKSAKQVGSSNRLWFTLQVNPNGKTFAQEGPTGEKMKAQSYLIVTDKSTNLKITEDSITVKTKDGETTLKFGGSVTDEELKNITEWPKDEWKKLPVDEENQFFRLVVPNGVALTVQYEALVPTIGNNVPVSNQAGIEGIATSNVEYDRSLKVSYIDAGGSGSNYELTIEKADKNDREKKLKGAKFRFYIVIPEKESEKELEKSILLEKEEETEVSIKTEQITIGEETYNCMTESNWTFETGEGGRFKMADNNEKNLHWNLYPDYYYILVEEEAPSGYDKLKEPLLFYYGTEDGKNYKKYPDAKLVLPNADYVLEIDNEPTPYELPETGGFGTAYLYLLGSVFILAGGAFLLYNKRLARRRAGQ